MNTSTTQSTEKISLGGEDDAETVAVTAPAKKPATVSKAAPAKAVAAKPTPKSVPKPTPEEDTSTSDDVIANALTIVASPPQKANGSPSPIAQEVLGEDEEIETMGLPPTLEFRENVPNTVNGTAFEIRLYAEGCLDCSHLIPGAKQTHDVCHYSNNNPYCPAASLRVAFVGEQMRFIKRIEKAQSTGDSNRVLGILEKLNDQPIETKNAVLRAVGMIK